jgi:hypothetical protein
VVLVVVAVIVALVELELLVKVMLVVLDTLTVHHTALLAVVAVQVLLDNL